MALYCKQVETIGEFEENLDFENTKKMLKEAVATYKHLHNSKPVTLRVNQLDLIKIKAKAKRKNSKLL